MYERMSEYKPLLCTACNSKFTMEKLGEDLIRGGLCSQKTRWENKCLNKNHWISYWESYMHTRKQVSNRKKWYQRNFCQVANLRKSPWSLDRGKKRRKRRDEREEKGPLQSFTICSWYSIVGWRGGQRRLSVLRLPAELGPFDLHSKEMRATLNLHPPLFHRKLAPYTGPYTLTHTHPQLKAKHSVLYCALKIKGDVFFPPCEVRKGSLYTGFGKLEH